MPNKIRIAEVELGISETMAAILETRAGRADGKIASAIADPHLERLLGALARLKAEKLRLAIRQRLI